MMMRRQTDEQDSTVALWGNYLLCGLILGLLFVTDWFFSKSLLSETLVGLLVGVPLGWIGAMNGYFFPSARNNGNGQAKSTTPKSKGTDDAAKSAN